MDIPLLQTPAWQNFQTALGEKTFFEQNSDFQYLAILKNTPFGPYLYLPYGPVAENAKNFQKSLNSLSELAAKNSAFFVRIEPQNPNFAKILSKPLKNFPKIQKSTDLNPKETWVLTLEADFEKNKAKIPSRLFRYWKNAEKNSLKIETSKNPDDIKYLVDLQKSLAKSKKINTFPENYLKTQLAQPFSTLYLVKQNSEILAAGLIFDDEKTRYNLQGAQSPLGAKNHATGILTVQLILDAAAKNQKIFDFWGIAPENAPKNHPWAGFTNFKKSFAGSEKDYCGTWDLIQNPLKYRLYQFSRKINRQIQKLR